MERGDRGLLLTLPIEKHAARPGELYGGMWCAVDVAGAMATCMGSLEAMDKQLEGAGRASNCTLYLAIRIDDEQRYEIERFTFGI